VTRALAAVAVGADICYPLVVGEARQVLAAVVVVLSALAVLNAAGRSNLLPLLGICGLGAFAVEAWGVHTGVPFGAYAYTGHLGPRAVGVPLVVPLAWVSMAWPALCVARRLCPTRGPRVLVAALALTAWDVMLDPQLAAAGAWRWGSDAASVQGVPLHNDLGWLVCSALLMAALDRWCAPADDLVPVALWLWAWLGSVVADAVFLGLPETALVGGVTMGLVGVPLLARLVPVVALA
jgi:uncharacterized membrane protein